MDLGVGRVPAHQTRVEKVKGLLLPPIDRFRRAYGAASEDQGTAMCFVATNGVEFVDTTGNRRFWPILMKSLTDIEKIERDRDQLWAEALHWYRSAPPNGG